MEFVAEIWDLESEITKAWNFLSKKLINENIDYKKKLLLVRTALKFRCTTFFILNSRVKYSAKKKHSKIRIIDFVLRK